MKNTLYYLRKCERLLQFTNAPDAETEPLRAIIEKQCAWVERQRVLRNKNVECMKQIRKIMRKGKYKKALKDLGIRL